MRPSPYFKIGATVLILIILFLLLNLTSLSKPVKGFFYSISSPFQKSLWGAGDKVSGFFSTIGNAGKLKEENEKLKLKVQELLFENIGLQELKKENDALKSAMGIGLEKEFSLATAQIIGKDISQDFILINKGLKDGIKNGLTVITPQKALVGKIVEAGNVYSKVMLVSNKDSSYGTKIAGKNILGEIKGKNNLQIFLDRISLDDVVKNGDLIITTSLADIPEGLLVGEVSEVKKVDVDPFQQAEVKPAFDIREVEELFVILSQ